MSTNELHYTYDVFISYSHTDKAWVQSWLLFQLEKAGLKVCIDYRDFDIGVPSLVNMERAVNNSRCTLLVLTPAWVASEWAAFEALLTQMSDPAGRKRRLLPLLLQHCHPPSHISMFTYADFIEKAEWETQLQRVIAAVKGKLRLADVGPQLSQLTGFTESPFFVPFPHNHDFVGRSEDLTTLHQMLRQSNSPVGIRPTVLVGLGGIGKTQLAVEYAHMYRHEYTGGIFWLNTVNPLLLEFASLAEALGRADSTTSRDQAAHKAWDYLDARPDALVIFDNVVDPAKLNTPFASGLIPANLRCRTLFTTRQRDFPRNFQPFEVQVLPPMAAMRLLLRARSAVLQENHPEWGVARIICASLGWLPLALELAASYLEQYPKVTLPGYLDRLRKIGKLKTVDDTELHPEDLPTRHETAVAATLQTQWARLNDDDAKLLFQAAGQFPESAMIPVDRLSLLTGVSAEAAPGFATPLLQALKKLHAVSLIEELTDDRLRLHPLVREFANSLSPDSFCVELASRAATKLYNVLQLESHVTQRGIDSVLEDLRTALSFCLRDADKPDVQPTYTRLNQLETILGREAHNLRIENWKWQSAAYFAQQIYNRATDTGLSALAENARTRLQQVVSPFLKLVWRVGPQAPELERTLKGHAGAVMAVCVAHNYLISASKDCSLKIWDLQTGREIRTLEGHTDWVVDLTVSADGQQIISASNDKTIKIWDLETGQEVRTLRGHNDQLRALCLTSAAQLISVSRDGTLKVWDLNTGELIADHSDVKAFAVAGIPNSHDVLLASSRGDNALILLNLNTGEQMIRDVGHTEVVRAVAVTSDGRWMLSASEDRNLILLNLQQPQEIQTLSGHLKAVNDVAITSDNGYILSASDDKTIKVWDLVKRQEVRTLSGHAGEVLAVTTTPNGYHAISASADKTVKIWHLKVGQELPILSGHSGDLYAVKITPDGQYAISGSEDHTIKVWDLTSYQCVHTFSGHQAAVNALALTENGKRVISASSDGMIKLWDFVARRELYTLMGHQEAIHAVAITPNGQSIISASKDGTLKIWDANLRQELHSLTYQARVHDLRITPDGEYVICASQDYKLRVLEIKTGREVRTIEGHKDIVHAIAITLDGRRLISGSADRTLKVWDLQTGQELRSLIGHSRPIKAVAITDNGRYAVSASDDSSLKIWDLDIGQELQNLPLSLKIYPRAVEITPNGQKVVSAFSDGKLRIWPLLQTRNKPVFFGHSGPVHALARTPDNKYVISASADRTVRVWDLETGQEFQAFNMASEGLALAVQNDGKRIFAATKDGSIITWDLETRKASTIKGHKLQVHTLAITPDGDYIISASLDGTMKIWNSKTGQVIGTLVGHKETVSRVTTTPDGRYVLSAAKDGSLKLWEIQSGREVVTLLGHTQRVRSLAITPDSCYAASASEDRTLKIWDLQAGQVVDSIDTKVQIRNVTITSDGQYIIFTHKHTIKMLDWATRKTLASTALDNPLDSITTVSMDKRAIILAGDEAGNIYRLEYIF